MDSAGNYAGIWIKGGKNNEKNSNRYCVSSNVHRYVYGMLHGQDS